MFSNQLARLGVEVVESDGVCQLEHWAKPDPSNDATESVPLDAGELRVTGGLADRAVGFANGYRLAESAPIFEAGDELTLEVEGSDEVAPMSVTVTAPPSPVIASPPTMLDIGEDFSVTWTSPPGKGTLQLYLQVSWDPVKPGPSTMSSGPRDMVRCFADVSQGKLTMPASLLSQISTSGSEPAVIAGVVSNDVIHKVGGSLVRFSVQSTPVTPGGEGYFSNVDLKK
ncbi:hypothetical protein A7982_12548 [Minicystis rosea]|nr:hypothetical protein A7982_12548 [Minicystis rosea]